MFDIIIGPIFDGNKLDYFSLTWTKQTPSHISSYIWLVTYVDIFPKLPQSKYPCFVGKSPLLYSSRLRLIRHHDHMATLKGRAPARQILVAPLSESPEMQSGSVSSYGIFYHWIGWKIFTGNLPWFLPSNLIGLSGVNFPIIQFYDFMTNQLMGIFNGDIGLR